MTKNKFTQWSNELYLDLARHEGVKLTPYFDTEGFVTFGIGRNLVANPLTEEERRVGKLMGFKSIEFVKYLYEKDVTKVLSALSDEFGWISDLTNLQQRGLANFMFNIGVAEFRKFNPTWEHLKKGELADVEQHLRNSKWAKQVGEIRREEVIGLICNRIVRRSDK